MPVSLLTAEDRELWMQGEVEEVLTLQRAAPDGTLMDIPILGIVPPGTDLVPFSFPSGA